MEKILISAFQSGGVCSSSQSIDECMIKFKGRSTLKHYMPKKTIKRGFKVWSRFDSSTGYLYQFDIYTGKKDDATTEVGLEASVVRELSKTLIDEKVENTHIAFDNFFASVELLQYLFDNNILCNCNCTRRSYKLAQTYKIPKKIRKMNLNRLLWYLNHLLWLKESTNGESTRTSHFLYGNILNWCMY